MDSDLKAVLLKWAGTLEAKAGKAEEFLAAEVPQGLREYLNWLAVEHFTNAAMAGVVVVGILLGLRHAYRNFDRWETERNEAGQFAGFFGSVVGLILLVCLTPYAAFEAQKGVKVCIAPRIVLVEKAAELAKGK